MNLRFSWDNSAAIRAGVCVYIYINSPWTRLLNLNYANPIPWIPIKKQKLKSIYSQATNKITLLALTKNLKKLVIKGRTVFPR